MPFSIPQISIWNVTHTMWLHWVARNYGHIFTVCGPKLTKLSTSAQEKYQFATLFSIQPYLKLFIPEIFRIGNQVQKLSEICPKFWCFWATKFSFLTQFYEFVSPSNMCQNLVMIDQATSEIRCWKNKERKTRMKLQWHSQEFATGCVRSFSPFPSPSLSLPFPFPPIFPFPLLHLRSRPP